MAATTRAGRVVDFDDLATVSADTPTSFGAGDEELILLPLSTLLAVGKQLSRQAVLTCRLVCKEWREAFSGAVTDIKVTASCPPTHLHQILGIFPAASTIHITLPNITQEDKILSARIHPTIAGTNNNPDAALQQRCSATLDAVKNLSFIVNQLRKRIHLHIRQQSPADLDFILSSLQPADITLDPFIPEMLDALAKQLSASQQLLQGLHLKRSSTAAALTLASFNEHAVEAFTASLRAHAHLESLGLCCVDEGLATLILSSLPSSTQHTSITLSGSFPATVITRAIHSNASISQLATVLCSWTSPLNSGSNFAVHGGTYNPPARMWTKLKVSSNGYSLPPSTQATAPYRVQPATEQLLSLLHAYQFKVAHLACVAELELDVLLETERLPFWSDTETTRKGRAQTRPGSAASTRGRSNAAAPKEAGSIGQAVASQSNGLKTSALAATRAALAATAAAAASNATATQAAAAAVKPSVPVATAPPIATASSVTPAPVDAAATTTSTPAPATAAAPAAVTAAAPTAEEPAAAAAAAAAAAIAKPVQAGAEAAQLTPTGSEVTPSTGTGSQDASAPASSICTSHNSNKPASLPTSAGLSARGASSAAARPPWQPTGTIRNSSSKTASSSGSSSGGSSSSSKTSVGIHIAGDSSSLPCEPSQDAGLPATAANGAPSNTPMSAASAATPDNQLPITNFNLVVDVSAFPCLQQLKLNIREQFHWRPGVTEHYFGHLVRQSNVGVTVVEHGKSALQQVELIGKIRAVSGVIVDCTLSAVKTAKSSPEAKGKANFAEHRATNNNVKEATSSSTSSSSKRVMTTPDANVRQVWRASREVIETSDRACHTKYVVV